jgi:GNAT superfamily N-acetyltransferase
VDARNLERRQVYRGEGLTIRVVSRSGEFRAEIVDMTPEGFGFVVEGPLVDVPAVFDTLVLHHTGRATSGIEHHASVRSVSTMSRGGQSFVRIGVELVAPKTTCSTVERRRAERFVCPEGIAATASAMNPLFFREWLHFGVVELGAGGMSLSTSIRNKSIVLGLELDFTVTFPLSGTQAVRGRITSVTTHRDTKSFVLGVAWSAPSRELLAAVSEYLLLGNKELSPARLREGGLKVGSIEHAVTYDYAMTAADHAAVLELRLRAHQAENRLDNATVEDMVSPYDAHSRHLTCRFGGRIVGYVRVIYVDGVPARSQYVTEGGHEVPEWLWKAGFVEAGAGATDPEFQRAGLFLPLMQHSLRVAAQSGFRYVLGACSDELLDMYQQMGFELLETREVEPKAGWRFRSHLICLDSEKLESNPPAGKAVAAMASAVAFVGHA